MKSSTLKVVVCALALAVVGFSVACGGGGANAPTSLTSGGTLQPNLAPITVNLSDGPLNGVLSFNVTFSAVTLTGSAGTVSVLSQPTTIEFIRLAGKHEPLTLTSIPQGTYTSMQVSVSQASGTILSAGGQVVAFTPTLPNGAVTINFPSPVTFSATHTTINLELRVGQSLSVDNVGNVSFSPIFGLSAAATDNKDDHSGKVLIAGPVTAVNAGTFTISIHDGKGSLTFTVDGNTKFDGITALSQLQVGQIALVYAITQSGGTLLAQKVEVRTMDVHLGLEVEGFVAATTGSPVTGFVLAVRHPEGPTPLLPAAGLKLPVTVTQNTTFKIESDLDLTGVSFAKFDASTLGPGQAVEVATDLASMMSIGARGVELTEQGVVGTISNYSVTNGVGTFTLTTTADSPFAIVAGTRTIQVTQRASTTTASGVTPANGAVVRVGGLLFFAPGTSGAPGTYNMLARGILLP